MGMPLTHSKQLQVGAKSKIYNVLYCNASKQTKVHSSKQQRKNTQNFTDLWYLRESKTFIFT